MTKTAKKWFMLALLAILVVVTIFIFLSSKKVSGLEIFDDKMEISQMSVLTFEEDGPKESFTVDKIESDDKEQIIKLLKEAEFKKYDKNLNSWTKMYTITAMGYSSDTVHSYIIEIMDDSIEAGLIGINKNGSVHQEGGKDLRRRYILEKDDYDKLLSILVKYVE